jgi:hypothetical protein
MSIRAKRVDKHGKPIKCAICNEYRNNSFDDKICLICYFENSEKIPKHIPFEQHDLWIIKNNERNKRNEKLTNPVSKLYPPKQI